MIMMIAAGLLSLGGIRRETFPDALPVEVEISVLYPGAATEEIEQSIVQRLEEELEGVQFVKEMRGVATSNRGTVTLEMTEAGDYTAFRNEIENAVNSIPDFPTLAEPPLIRRLNTKDPLLDVLVEGPTDAVALKSYCEDLKDRLLQSNKVSEIEITGFADPVLRVELSTEALLRHQLSPTQIASAIAGQSIDLSAGEIKSGENTLVRVQEERRGARELEDLVVAAAPGGAELRIADLGEVIDEFKAEEDLIAVEGGRSAVLKFMKAKTQDSLEVAAEINSMLEAERRRNPDVQLTVINDMSALVNDRISLLKKNGLQGCVMVFAVMWLFFNARLSFWVVASLPVSFLAAFAIVPSAGLTINMLTMVGLLMAIGVLMDDGIVIAENIARRHRSGEPPMVAAVEGVREVGGGVVSSFLTTCCVLGPLIFLSGDIGRILRVLPMMLLLVLAASLIEAFLILPAHLAHSLESQDHAKQPRFRKRINALIDAAQERVGRAVDWTIQWRYLTLGLVVLAFLLTIGLLVGGVVRGQVFPILEGDTIVARILMKPGTPLARTREVVDDLESALEATNASFKPKQPMNRDLVETTYVRFSENKDAMETGPHVATMYADLLTNELRDARIADVVTQWEERLGPVADSLKITFDEPVIGPQDRAIEVELSGVPLDQLDKASDQIQAYLKTYDGVYNITDDLRKGQKELLVKLRPGAVGLGINAQELARQLRGSFQGLLADQVQIGDQNYDVEVRYSIDDRNDFSDLNDARVFLPSGEAVPLTEIAELEVYRGWSRIGRLDGRQVVNVLGSVDASRTNTLAVLGQVRAEKWPEIEARFPGIEMNFKGEAERGAETGGSLLWAAAIGCLGVFVILSFQFRGYMEPFIVMIAIPFAFVGVVWGHFLFGLSLSLPSMMGYASLSGIVVNDSILLMLFLKSRRAEGEDPLRAASEASRMRFRAVMITSLTTIAGLMPLLLERSLQAQVLIPIAISICFGLLASTALILLVLPSLYMILNDFGLTSAVATGADAEH